MKTFSRPNGAFVALIVAVYLLCVSYVFAWDTLYFDLPSNARESAWRDALAEYLDGTSEVGIEGGRIDVLTDDLAIEVDFQHKWHEGLGQALHYAHATGKEGVVALITYSQSPETMREKSRRRLEMVEELLKTTNIRLIVMFPGRPKEKPQKDWPDSPLKGEQKYKYWLNSESGVRHNSDCRYYKATEQGYDCGPKEGHPCSICGG